MLKTLIELFILKKKIENEAIIDDIKKNTAINELRKDFDNDFSHLSEAHNITRKKFNDLCVATRDSLVDKFDQFQDMELEMDDCVSDILFDLISLITSNLNSPKQNIDITIYRIINCIDTPNESISIKIAEIEQKIKTKNGNVELFRFNTIKKNEKELFNLLGDLANQEKKIVDLTNKHKWVLKKLDELKYNSHNKELNEITSANEKIKIILTRICGYLCDYNDPTPPSKKMEIELYLKTVSIYNIGVKVSYC